MSISMNVCRQSPVKLCRIFPPPPLLQITTNITLSVVVHAHMQSNRTPPQHSVHLYKLLAVSCIDHVPPNLQGGHTPLMLAVVFGHLPVARLLVETYHCDVNEEDGEVSGWEVMGGVSEYSTCVSSHM